jgi:hypothetical protein
VSDPYALAHHWHGNLYLSLLGHHASERGVRRLRCYVNWVVCADCHSARRMPSCPTGGQSLYLPLLMKISVEDEDFLEA